MAASRLLSWNINGIRAIQRKGFAGFLKKDKPDFICLQEVKISDEVRAKENLDFLDYQEFWHSAKRPGYSGTLTLAKKGMKVKQLPNMKWDDEGRACIVDAGKYYLANVYFPNANSELSRLGFKMKFNDKLLGEFKKLDKKKPVVVTGDYNVAHNEIDLARPKDNVGKHGFTQEERDWMTKFLAAGWKDTFREMHPNKVQYSWWNLRSGARARNVGWRIDYFCVSSRYLKNVKNSFILDKVQGSDHAPVGIEI